ncbi:hypothetical protein [Allohahella marinimesophila]|uniref:Methyltransferase family protein n=1 Tax=Allohahella marinimesophila TaxID=1054972 RepID=A0ABP7PY62_9GAMM
MKKLAQALPAVSSAARQFIRKMKKSNRGFTGSGDYWKSRYSTGGNSGDGSYNELARFKAEQLNDFVQSKGIRSVIEYGCGDGNQLKLAGYPAYIGFDVSETAVGICRSAFADDRSKSFKTVDHYDGETAELTLSLDVVYHLVEDSVFEGYMHRLFDSSTGYVIVYSSNTDENPAKRPDHVRHRRFTDWVQREKPNWALRSHVPNKYPYRDDTKTGSSADFYFFEKS